MDYENYMRRCLALARLGEYSVAPNPMVGAVLVDAEGLIIGEGWHRRFGGAHAEVECLRDADRRFPNADLSRATLFVSLEPCSHQGKTPPCADLLVRRKIGRVVVGCSDSNPLVGGQGLQRLREAGIEVHTGVLEEECRHLNKRFFCLHEQGRPYVVLKWAQSADGFLARPGERTLISNPLTKILVHRMRAENMAILIGSGTALTDNPRLLCTHWTGPHPVRILLDRRQRVSHDSRLFSSEAPTIVISEDTSWEAVLRLLAARGLHSVLVEGGATVLQHILASGRWDEMHIEVNPTLVLTCGTASPVPPRILSSLPAQTACGNLLYTLSPSSFSLAAAQQVQG